MTVMEAGTPLLSSGIRVAVTWTCSSYLAGGGVGLGFCPKALPAASTNAQVTARGARVKIEAVKGPPLEGPREAVPGPTRLDADRVYYQS